MPTYTTVPVELVRSLLDQHPATRTELDAIRDRRDPDRYQGVYAHVHGGRYAVRSYRARVLKFFELGSGFDSPKSAAAAVVAFYKAYYGPDWQRAFRLRKVTPWRLRRVRRRVCWSHEPQVIGYAADIYLRGRPVAVTEESAYGRSPGASERWMWATPAEAKKAARAAMARRFDRESGSLPVPHPGVLFWRG